MDDWFDHSREQRVRSLIDEWREKLGLFEWDVRYTTEPPPDEDDEACIFSDEHERIAQVYIDPGAPDDAVPYLVVHELLHLALFDAFTLGAAAAAQHHTILADELDDHFEYAINRIAGAMTKRVLYGKRLTSKHMTAFIRG